MTKKNIIKNAPNPVGNYPHSVIINGILYLSGIGPRNPVDNSIPGNEYNNDGDLVGYNIEQQTHAVFDNIKSKNEIEFINSGGDSLWVKEINNVIYLSSEVIYT